jgi:integrase
MLTESEIEKIPTRAAAYRVSCPATTGFHVKIMPSGMKVYELRTKGRYYRLGTVGLMSIDDARELLRKIKSRIERGLSPDLGSVDLLLEGRLEPVAPPAVATPAVATLPEPAPGTYATFGELLDAWVSHQKSMRRRSVDDSEKIIRQSLTDELLAKEARAVTARDIRSVLAKIHQRGARVQSNRVRSHLHSLFAYGAKVDYDPARMDQPTVFEITGNPVSLIPRDAGADRVVERYLSWAEVKMLWHAEEPALSWIGRQAVRLAILTGQRVNEVAQARWAEFDLEEGRWSLPAARQKMGRDHLIPLGPMAISLLQELREVYPGEWLFPWRNVSGAANCWHKSTLGHVCSRAARGLGLAHFTARDLRRTFKTLTGDVGLSLEIRDRLQGHSLPGVATKHYDRYGYWKEKMAATLLWEQALKDRLGID